jgi:two-component sensor histidine kinase
MVERAVPEPQHADQQISDTHEFRLEAENLDLRRLLTQAGIDAAEHKVAEKLQRIMVEELHHRVKNILATVQAIASQSLRVAQNIEDGRKAIESRLQALGRVHDVLLQTNWSKTKLVAILKAGVEPFITATAPQIAMRSADIEVAPAAALPLAMILNELCTNAVKYGALSRPTGRVNIEASVTDSGDSFLLTWMEKGGPTVQEPARRSFGSKLIEHAFVAQLQATARLSFDPHGVIYELRVPLAELNGSIAS